MSRKKTGHLNPLQSFSRRRFIALTGSLTAGAALPIGSTSAELADGDILNSEFWWVEPGAPQTGNTYALRLKDNPESDGIMVNSPFTSDADVTMDFYWRHHAGGGGSSATYMWNDLGSGSVGFRAFTNGTAGSGFYFRNPFGGNDVTTATNYQDGDWHHIRLILDASTNDYLVYIDGQLIGQEFYDGSGFEAEATFRICGEDDDDGSGDEIEYDRFVITDEALYLEDEQFPDSDQIHFELEEGQGDTVGNNPEGLVEDCIDRHDKSRGQETIQECGDDRDRSRDSDPRRTDRRDRRRTNR